MDMNQQNESKVLLSVKDLEVKFRVRGRILTAIRGISLDIHENESIAIVGESGSGKSVFTKTFAGMLDDNGFISNGSIIFNDNELSDTKVLYEAYDKAYIKFCYNKLNGYSKSELGASIWNRILALDGEKAQKENLSTEEAETFDEKLNDLVYRRTEAYNLKVTLDPAHEKQRIAELANEIVALDGQIKQTKAEKEIRVAENRKAARADSAYLSEYRAKRAALMKEYDAAVKGEITDETKERNERIAKEIYLSVGRFGFVRRMKSIVGLLRELKRAMKIGVDLNDEEKLNAVFDKVAFRVAFKEIINEVPKNAKPPKNPDEKPATKPYLYGTCVINVAKIKYEKDWTQIRGRRIATVFQDPMTSLNPVLTIGKQISSVIMKHQGCSEGEARTRALVLMQKVGIPNAEKRYDDYPFQYSGGMRQRIVIAIALSCQPKILICDEPTTALDVTIQAQILKLLKDLQKEFGYTIVFITHDLGVVAKVADRVAVLYAGQIVELGTAEEVFYDPRHPYTWALLSSLPQLAERNTTLYSISGTPPSLYNKIVGDPFAPRNPYCMKIDTVKDAPMFKVSDTHYAKTWLLDPRSPKVEKPEIIHDTYNKLIKAFNIDMGGEDQNV